MRFAHDDQRAPVGDILAAVEKHVALKRANDRIQKGICPLHEPLAGVHEDRVLPFRVDTVTGVFRCYICGATGDAQTFVEKIQAREALKLVDGPSPDARTL